MRRMADRAHLKLLASGPDAWNAWRDQNPGLTPDLSVADLVSKNLSGANLTYANLSWADMRDARCEYTDLSGADLTNANMSKATFRASRFNGCRMAKAYLVGSDFSPRYLRERGFKWGLSLRRGIRFYQFFWLQLYQRRSLTSERLPSAIRTGQFSRGGFD